MWFWYALIAAIISAISVILNKRALKFVGAPLVSWALSAFSIPLLIYPSFSQGWPKINEIFFIGTVGSSVVFALGKTMSLDSMKKGHLSHIVPLSCFSSLFTYFFGLIFLQEYLKPIHVIGLLLILFGTYILKITEAKEDILKPFKLLFTNPISLVYLLSMVLMGASAILDKLGLINVFPSNPYFVLLVENIIMTMLLTSYMVKIDKKWVTELRSSFSFLLVSGLTYSAMVIFLFYGFQSGPTALASGIKKLEVIFILVLSQIFFQDRPKKEVWVGSLIMIIGAVLIKLT